MLPRDDRIFEEGSGTADLGRVWEFGVADAYDGLADVGRIESAQVVTLQRCPHPAVIQFRAILASYLEQHAGNDVAAALVLEAGIAIAVCALAHLEHGLGPILRVEAYDPGDDILSLHPVGPYVLHRSGTHLAGNQRKVLRAPEAVSSHIGYEIVENHARTDGQQDLVQTHVHILDELYAGMQYRAWKVFGKQQVAPGPDVEHWLRQGLQVQRLQFFHIFIFYVQRRLHLHPEGVMCAKVVVFNSLHICSRFPLFFGTKFIFSSVCSENQPFSGTNSKSAKNSGRW